MSDGPIIFVQPFGLSTACGGSRILRALLDLAPLPWVSVNTMVGTQRSTLGDSEFRVPMRPSFGRLERSRYAAIPNALEMVFGRGFKRRLRAIARRLNASAIHVIP